MVLIGKYDAIKIQDNMKVKTMNNLFSRMFVISYTSYVPYVTQFL